MTTADKLNQIIAQHSGTLGYHRLLGNYVGTDGIKAIANEGGLGWLIDIVVSGRLVPDVAREKFQFWKLTVDLERRRGLVVCTDGNDHRLYVQETHYVDTPIPEVTLYVVEERELMIVMLSREY